MDNTLKALEQILKLRHNPWLIIFTAKNTTQDSAYSISFKVVIKPETDAILFYEGSDIEFDKAFDCLAKNVIGDFPKENYSE